ACGPLDALLLVTDVDPRLGRRVAGVQNPRLAGPAGAFGVNDRKDLARCRQPRVARRVAPDRVEEIERDEVEILVERFERGDLLLVDADSEVGLAHPDLDVEVAVERLLV